MLAAWRRTAGCCPAHAGAAHHPTQPIPTSNRTQPQPLTAPNRTQPHPTPQPTESPDHRRARLRPLQRRRPGGAALLPVDPRHLHLARGGAVCGALRAGGRRRGGLGRRAADGEGLVGGGVGAGGWGRSDGVCSRAIRQAARLRDSTNLSADRSIYQPQPTTSTESVQAWVYHITWFVNSASHVWGYQDYDSGDQSRNNW